MLGVLSTRKWGEMGKDLVRLAKYHAILFALFKRLSELRAIKTGFWAH